MEQPIIIVCHVHVQEMVQLTVRLLEFMVSPAASISMFDDIVSSFYEIHISVIAEDEPPLITTKR